MSEWSVVLDEEEVEEEKECRLRLCGTGCVAPDGTRAAVQEEKNRKSTRNRPFVMSQRAWRPSHRQRESSTSPDAPCWLCFFRPPWFSQS